MKLPERDTWLRVGYGLLGSATAVGWNKVFSVHAEKGGYIPPALICGSIIASDNCGATEKDLAAAGIGYLATAQAISWLQPSKQAASLSGAPNPSQTPQAPAVASEQSLQKIQLATQALGAVLGIVSQFKGNK
jgi:hypothetical protein